MQFQSHKIAFPGSDYRLARATVTMDAILAWLPQTSQIILPPLLFNLLQTRKHAASSRHLRHSLHTPSPRQT